MSSFREVRVAARSPDVLFDMIGAERVRRFRAAGDALAEVLAGRTVWNVSLAESATGVGVLVRSVLGYLAGFGISTRWLVIEPMPALREIERWIRQGLQGVSDQEPRLSPDHRAVYEQVLAVSGREVAGRVQSGDLVLLHDPGPAGLARAALDRGAAVVWRCHAGSVEMNESAQRAWAFLQPYIQDASGFVFSRRGWVPPWVPPDRVALIAPSIDPLSPKNRPLSQETVHEILTWAGLLEGDTTIAPRCTHGDGTEAPMRYRAQLNTRPPSREVPLVVQVTRWDPLKDMPGVLTGFAHHVTNPDAQLLLAGPDPTTAEADPIARIVFEHCTRARDELPAPLRQRIHLAALPADTDDSATIVNALQRHATVVAQKCLAGDQSAAVAEAMLKARPIVASGVGGIRDQIHDHHNGLLIDDPADLMSFGAAITELLTNVTLANELRYNAYQDAIDHALPDRHLLHWAGLVSTVLNR